CEMPGRAFDRHHGAHRIREEVFFQIKHHFQCIRKPRSEEVSNFMMSRQLREAVGSFKGKKQNAAKCPVDIRKRIQHVATARPNIKTVRFEYMFPIGSSRNGKFLVSVVEILLGKVEAIELEHFRANRRSGAVASYYNARLSGPTLVR